MKVCKGCSLMKEDAEFNKASKGLQSRCKLCVRIQQRERYQERKSDPAFLEYNATISRAQYSRNYEKRRTQQNEYFRSNWDSIKKSRKERNYIYVLHVTNRRAAVKRATPKWLTDEHRQEIMEIYKSAQERMMHVDHIVPLKGKLVCGLHVPWNLQLLTPSENNSKGNR